MKLKLQFFGKGENGEKACRALEALCKKWKFENSFYQQIRYNNRNFLETFTRKL